MDYVYRAGVNCEVVRNDVHPELLNIDNYSGLVISPGPQTPKHSGHLMSFIEAFSGKLPILGICLGHQAIGEFFGSTLSHGLKPVHGKVHEIYLKKDEIFQGVGVKTRVVRYNSLILRNIPAVLNVIAITKDEEVMAIKHRDLPIWGLQFHPEAALTDDGQTMIKNWVSCNNIT